MRDSEGPRTGRGGSRGLYVFPSGRFSDRAAAECVRRRQRRHAAPLEPELWSLIDLTGGAMQSLHKPYRNALTANCTSCKPSLSDDSSTQPSQISPMRRRWLSRPADRLSSAVALSWITLETITLDQGRRPPIMARADLAKIAIELFWL